MRARMTQRRGIGLASTDRPRGRSRHLQCGGGANAVVERQHSWARLLSSLSGWRAWVKGDLFAPKRVWTYLCPLD
jgi:hypothetical protein